MPTQPIPSNIIEKDKKIGQARFNTLLIDGPNMLFYAMYRDGLLQKQDEPMRGIFIFLLHIKILLEKYNFRYVYVFWDGISSGQLRHDIYPEYKAKREKVFEEVDQSDYMRSVNERIRELQQYLYFNRGSKDRNTYKKTRRELFFAQRDVLIDIFDELFIRQCLCDYTEADDLIGYYVAHKKPTERIVILSTDKDVMQLISNDVIVYSQALKKFINRQEATKMLGYHYSNVKTMKIICGDVSDGIKGINLVGEKRLTSHFPRLLKESVSVDEIREEAKKFLEDAKKKGSIGVHQWARNIVDCVTLGTQGKDMYEINERLIDLTNPLMPEEAKQMLDDMMYAPIDPEGRSLENVYKLILKYNVDMLQSEYAFASFFRPFETLIKKEERNTSVYDKRKVYPERDDLQ